MKQKLKTLFLRLTLREKLLTVLFLWVCIFIWAVILLDEFGNRSLEWRAATETVSSQRQWLALKELVDSELQDNLRRFNPEHTFNSSALVGRVDRIARNSGGVHDIATPRTQSGDIFELHSMRVNLRNASMDTLLKFEDVLRGEFPYINVENVRINADTRNPEQLNAQFIINSFELDATALN